MRLDDRFSRGFLGGLIGAIPMNIISWGFYSVNYSKLTFNDWAAVMVYGKTAHNLEEIIVAQIAQFLFCGLVGGIFTLIIPFLSSKSLYLKGTVYGASIWFILNGMVLLFKVKKFIPISAPTAIVQSVGSAVWGIFLVLTLIYLERHKVN